MYTLYTLQYFHLYFSKARKRNKNSFQPANYSVSCHLVEYFKIPKQIFQPISRTKDQVTFILVNKLLSNTKIEQIPGWKGEMKKLLICYHCNWYVYKHVWGTGKRREKKEQHLIFLYLFVFLFQEVQGVTISGVCKRSFTLFAWKPMIQKSSRTDFPDRFP